MRARLRLPQAGSKLGLFLMAGSAGFATDAAVFFALLSAAGFDPAWCRVVASCVATVVTWRLNRAFAFKRTRADTLLAEFGKYSLASLSGATANLLVVLAAVPFDAFAYHLPAYTLGAAAGLVVNYALYDRVVFQARALRDL